MPLVPPFRRILPANLETTVLTCHDEYLLPATVQGVDSALVGFASLAPDLIAALYQAVGGGDLRTVRHCRTGSTS